MHNYAVVYCIVKNFFKLQFATELQTDRRTPDRYTQHAMWPVCVDAVDVDETEDLTEDSAVMHVSCLLSVCVSIRHKTVSRRYIYELIEV